VRIFGGILLCLFLAGCTKNTDGMFIVRERKPQYCINGWSYYDHANGPAPVALDKEGKPIPCSMKERK